MGMRIGFDYLSDNLLGVRIDSDDDLVARFDIASEEHLGQFVLKVFLDRTFKRASAELYVAAFGCDKVFGFVADSNCKSEVGHTAEESGKLDVDNFEMTSSIRFKNSGENALLSAFESTL